MVLTSVPPPPPGPPPIGSSTFDVYIVGSESLGAPGQMKLAGLIASRYRVAAPQVAEGLAGGQCLVGNRLAEGAANRLAEELRDLGAVSQVQPAGVPLRLATRRADESGREKSGDVTRCPIHGIFYDRTKSSGCLRCMQPARSAARALEERLHPSRLAGFGDRLQDPIKRALAGLALALLVGLVPAAYYARGMCGVEIARIRARQAELGQQTSTKEINLEFDNLDLAVAGVRHRGVRNTAVLWLLVTAITGAAWYKLADGRTNQGEG